MLDSVLRLSAGVIVALLHLLVFRTPLLHFFRGPLVDDGVIQICIPPGSLADDANDMEIGSNIISTIGLQARTHT